MKRFITILTISLSFFVAAASAQESQTGLCELLESYQDTKGVEYMELKGLMLSFAKPALKGTPMKEMVDCIDNLCVFSMSGASKDALKTFDKELDSILSTYEKVLQKKEGKNESTIFIKRKDDASVSEMLVCSSNEDIAIVVMKGEIPLALLEEMSAQGK